MIQMIIERLRNGETIENYKESGNSMRPLINHRQPITLAPVEVDKVDVGDVVLVKVKGNIYTHLVKGVKKDSVLIGNNHGKLNGWTHRTNIYGIVTHVEGKEITSSREKVKK